MSGSSISLRSSLLLQKQRIVLPLYSTQDGVRSGGHGEFWATVSDDEVPGDAQPDNISMAVIVAAIQDDRFVNDMLI